MFYCEECGTKNGWPQGLSGSKGPCEVCKKIRICSNIPSSMLPPKVKEKQKNV